MVWFEKLARLVFLGLFGVLFSGVFFLLALETSIRRWRDDRLARRRPPMSALEAAYRARPKTRPTVGTKIGGTAGAASATM